MCRAPTADDPYAARAREYADRFEAAPFGTVHAAWLHLLPAGGGAALDVGAGSGRDAAALARRGFEVVAAEPSDSMRAEAGRRHSSELIHWLDDALPDLANVRRLGRRFDLVLLSAVWQQVAPEERRRALDNLAALLAPGGLLVVTLRLGPPDESRGMHAVDAGELEDLAAATGLERIPLSEETVPDLGGRPQIRWGTRAFRRDVSLG